MKERNPRLPLGDFPLCWPPNPSPLDSNEVILNYFRLCFAATFAYPPSSREIQTLEFAFEGTGADLYCANLDAIVDYVGNKFIASVIDGRLRRSIYNLYPWSLRIRDFFTSYYLTSTSASSLQIIERQCPSPTSVQPSQKKTEDVSGLSQRKVRISI